jgi:hypothetical protein
MTNLIRRAATLALLLAPLVACKAKDGDKPAPAPTTVPGQVAKDFVQTRDRVIEAMTAKLTELDTKIARLKQDLAARVAAGQDAAATAFDAALAKLEEQRAAAHAALDQAKGATEDRWDQLQRKADDTLKRIDQAYQDTATQLRQ